MSRPASTLPPPRSSGSALRWAEAFVIACFVIGLLLLLAVAWLYAMSAGTWYHRAH